MQTAFDSSAEELSYDYLPSYIASYENLPKVKKAAIAKNQTSSFKNVMYSYSAKQNTWRVAPPPPCAGQC